MWAGAIKLLYRMYLLFQACSVEGDTAGWTALMQYWRGLWVGRYVARVLGEAKRLIVAQPVVTLLGKGTDYGAWAGSGRLGKVRESHQASSWKEHDRSGCVEGFNVVKKETVGHEE